MKDFPRALAWIVLSTLMITGTSYKLIRSYLNDQQAKNTSPAYYLSRIVQTGPQKEALSSDYLAEVIGISADRPICVGKFNTKIAEARLLSSPVIKKAALSLVHPDTIYVDYTACQPIAWLDDFENTALDSEGCPFPIFPFFTPKNLPRIHLGISSVVYKRRIQDHKLELAFEILKLSANLPFSFKRIDTSHALDPSLGTREIIVTIEEGARQRFLRLTPAGYAKQLGDYLELRGKLPAQDQLVDLRLPQIGFVKAVGQRSLVHN